MRKVLVPLDGSELAARAISYLDYLVGPGDAVFLVMVEELLPAEAGFVPERRTRALEGYRQALVAKGVRAEATFLYGHNAVLAYAEEVGVDTVLMSSHGRTDRGRRAYGSVAYSLFSHFGGEVCMVRPPQAALREETGQAV